MLQSDGTIQDGQLSPQRLDRFISIVEGYLADATNPGFRGALRRHLDDLRERRQRAFPRP